MKRKLLQLKSLKTLKSLHKNLSQKYDGAVKDIERREKRLSKISDDISKVEELIVEKETR